MIFIGRFLLQRKICVVVFSEIHGFCLERNTLAGVIFEFAAGLFCAAQAFLCAKHLAVLQHGAVAAIGAGTFYLFPKQHNGIPLDFLQSLYYSRLRIATSFFHFLQQKRKKPGNKTDRMYKSHTNSAKQQTETGLQEFSQKVIP